MTERVQNIKERFAKELAEAAAGMDSNHKLLVAINLNIGPATFDRYTSGKIKEVRRLELAEKILDEIASVKASVEAVA